MKWFEIQEGRLAGDLVLEAKALVSCAAGRCYESCCIDSGGSPGRLRPLKLWRAPSTFCGHSFRGSSRLDRGLLRLTLQGAGCRVRCPVDCSPPGSSVHGMFQARILEWVAIASSRGSSPPRNQTPVSTFSCLGRFFPCRAMGASFEI